MFRRRRGLEVFDKYYTVLDRHVYIACSPEQEWAWEQATRASCVSSCFECTRQHDTCQNSDNDFAVCTRTRARAAALHHPLLDAFSRLMCAVTKMIVWCRARARDIGMMLPLIGHGD